MSRLLFVIALSLSLGAPWGATTAHAQAAAPASSAATTTAQQASSDDDDAALRPLEPDFTVVNLPTTLPLPLKTGGNFHLTHRFVGVNFRRDDASTIATNLFGFDGPAIIQLEYRIAVMKHLEAIVARTEFRVVVVVGRRRGSGRRRLSRRRIRRLSVNGHRGEERETEKKRSQDGVRVSRHSAAP